MTNRELIERLSKLDPDKVVIYTEICGSWTNIEIDDTSSEVTTSIVPAIEQWQR